MFHGGSGDLHIGICLTDDFRAAAHYANKNMSRTVAAIGYDFGGLTVLGCDDAGTDDDGDFYAPGDDGDNLGADVLRFDDLDPNGRTHTTWRLMTAAAVAACSIVETIDADQD